MLDPPAGFVAAIAEDQLKLAEIYDVVLVDGTDYHYTSHDQDIQWGSAGYVYTALPIARQSISTQINMQAQQVTISLANISGDLVSLLQDNVITGSTITIKRILYDQTWDSGLEITLFIGRAEVEYNRRELKLTCTSVLDSLNIMVPRNMYQSSCNHKLYSTGCGLTKTDWDDNIETIDCDSPYYFETTRFPCYKFNFDNVHEVKRVIVWNEMIGLITGKHGDVLGIEYNTDGDGVVTGTVYYYGPTAEGFQDGEGVKTSGDPSTFFVVDGVPEEAPEAVSLAEVEVTVVGSASYGDRRLIRRVIGQKAYVFPAFTASLEAGSMKLYLGCTKTPSSCWGKGNIANYSGFPYIPKSEEVMM